MAVVYEAKHVVLPRRAAIKVMHEDLQAQWAARERLLQEARILEQVQHPGLLRIYDVGTLDDGRPWLAIELVEGLNLAQRLAVHRTLEPMEVMTILDAVAAALDAAHRQGVVHRDLKPENIMLGRGLDGFAVKVIDWGIARVPDDGGARLTNALLAPGTPLYMSPEQARGKAVDGRSDVYALGVIACEALTGQPPFDGECALDVVMQHLNDAPPTLRSRRPELAEELDRLVLSMLAKHVAARPTMTGLREQLAELAKEQDLDYDDVSVEFELDLDDPDLEVDDPDVTLLDRPKRRERSRWTPEVNGSTVVSGLMLLPELPPGATPE